MKFSHGNSKNLWKGNKFIMYEFIDKNLFLYEDLCKKKH